MGQELVFETRGNVEILSQKKIAIFASRATPQEFYPRALTLFNRLAQQDVAIASGWQAPLEKFLFKKGVGLQIRANIIKYLPRDLNCYQLSYTEQVLLDENKLLLVAPDTDVRRPEKKWINRRDALLFSQIKHVLFLYIVPGGRLESYFNQLLNRDYHVYLPEDAQNSFLNASGVIKLNEQNVAELLGV